MSRATAVYLCMLAALVGGLWAVLRLGSGLRAPPDLSGRWELQPLDPAGPERPAGEERLGRSARVDQSGRFFRVEFERGRVLNLRLLRASAVGKGPGRRVRMELGDGQWTLVADGPPARDEMIFHLDGPLRRAFAGRRTVRTYPQHAGSGPVRDAQSARAGGAGPEAMKPAGGEGSDEAGRAGGADLADVRGGSDAPR